MSCSAAVAAQQQNSADRDAAKLHNEGVEAVNLKDWELATMKFEDALLLKEDVAATHSALATSAWNLEDWPKVEKHARRTLELNPGNEYETRLLAAALGKQGREEEENALRDEIAEFDPVLKAELAYNKGAAAANAQDDKAAVAAFEEAIAGQHFVEDHTKGPDVAAPIDFITTGLFGAHVGRSAQHGAGPGQGLRDGRLIGMGFGFAFSHAVGGESAGQAKVRQSRAAV